MTKNSDPGWNPLNGMRCRREAGGSWFINVVSLNPELVCLFHINILSIYSASSHGWSDIKIQITYFLGSVHGYKLVDKK